MKPLGSETPYSLNIDKKRSIVWVNGNTSDALYAYYYKEDRWQHYPMAKKVTFTRDVEIAPDGTVFTTNSSFPSWHIEDAQPTLIVLKPALTCNLYTSAAADDMQREDPGVLRLSHKQTRTL